MTIGTMGKMFLVAGVIGLCSFAGMFTYAKVVNKSTAKTTQTWKPHVTKQISAPDEEKAAPKKAEDLTPGERDELMLQNTNIYVYRGAPVAEGFAIYIVMWNGNYLFMSVVQENTELIAPEPDEPGTEAGD